MKNGQPTILVVDDEATIRDLLGGALEEAGFNVVLAASAREAMSRVADTPVEVVITDLHMGDLSGVDLIRLLRQFGEDIPVIMMTAYPNVYRGETAVRVNACGYLAKPFDMTAAIDLVRKACSHVGAVEPPVARV